jgi:hypothetical protein
MAIVKAFIYIHLNVLSSRSSFQYLARINDFFLLWNDGFDAQTCATSERANLRSCRNEYGTHTLEGSGVATGSGAASGAGVGASNAEHSRYVLVPA